MSLSSPTFNADQLAGEIKDRSYLMPTEIETFVKNLIRIVAEQHERIRILELRVNQSGPAT